MINFKPYANNLLKSFIDQRLLLIDRDSSKTIKDKNEVWIFREKLYLKQSPEAIASFIIEKQEFIRRLATPSRSQDVELLISEAEKI